MYYLVREILREDSKFSCSSLPNFSQVLMAHRSFSCFCCNLQFVPSIEKNIINFSLLQTVVRKTSIDGTTCRLQQKQLKPQWAIVGL